LQKIASNFISGIILLFEKSVEVGDIVELDNGGIYGTIKHFGGRYTLVEGSDGKEIMIPNEEFIINRVTNWTYTNNRARLEIKVGVDYKTNLKLAKEIMLSCALSHKRCIKYPEPECYVLSFNDFDISIILYFWINDIIEGRMGAKSDVMIDILNKFSENNIEIPLPKREVKISSS
ncbi:MAG: mechanosensitive ion channel family protein, partial [Alphaproteobacteria bacterium]